MEKLGTYRAIIEQVIQDYARHSPSHGEVETVAICDPRQDHYLVVHLGWSNQYRHDQPVLHLRADHPRARRVVVCLEPKRRVTDDGIEILPALAFTAELGRLLAG